MYFLVGLIAGFTFFWLIPFEKSGVQLQTYRFRIEFLLLVISAYIYYITIASTKKGFIENKAGIFKEQSSPIAFGLLATSNYTSASFLLFTALYVLTNRP